MKRGVCWYLVDLIALGVLVALAGCSHYMLAERDAWRHEAESACLNSGAVTESPGRVRISSIEGPGACGIDYPLRVSQLGDASPLGYEDEPVRPPQGIPNGSAGSAAQSAAAPQYWPGQSSSAVQSRALPPLQAQPQSSQQIGPPPSYGTPQPPASRVAKPLSLTPPGLPEPDDDEDAIDVPGGPPHPYYGGPNAQPAPPVTPQLGRGRTALASAGPVALDPPATLACPIVAALDQWISGTVQPAAARWFHQPVVEIKQISAYSCRGMNGNPNAHISEHAFGNALDVAEFDLADGHRVSVQYGWHGTPEEQGFLHDVQASACEQFTTVLAPGANVYHYNHIHVDLMRHYSGRHICEPSAIPGEVAAERARSHFATRHDEPAVTGSIGSKTRRSGHRVSGQDDDSLPEAEPGAD